MVRILFFLSIFSIFPSSFTADGAEFLEGLISQFVQSSPTSMMHSWISFMDPPQCISNSLHLMGTAVQTQDDELQKLATEGNVDIGYDCNLTGIDAECFLEYISAALGESWNSANEDVEQANEMIHKYLLPGKKTMSAALILCVSGHKLIPMLSNSEKRINDASPIINDAKEHCKL